MGKISAADLMEALQELGEQIEFCDFGGAIMPKMSSEGSIGFDLYAPDDVTIPANSRYIVNLKFGIGLPLHVEAKIEPRSGYSSKGMEGWQYIEVESHDTKECVDRYDTDVINGKVDPHYKDAVGVIVKNHSDKSFIIKKGTRIAQMTFYPTIEAKFKVVSKLSGLNRGGGFGHSNEESK